MNGLRVYVSPTGTGTPSDDSVFYSRREHGPYYRWRYEEEFGRWLGSRVHPSDLTLKALCIANWKAVPTALRSRLGEHYLE